MLIWPCDFVIASDDATFQDNTMYMGIPGVEYFAHVWELGIRKAKEFLLTGQPITAEEAQAAGMVNRVVPRDELEEANLSLCSHAVRQTVVCLKTRQRRDQRGFSRPRL